MKFLLIPFLLGFCLVSHANTHTENSRVLADIAERYFTQRLQLDPLEGSATLGEEQYEDKVEITIAPGWLRKSSKLAEKTLRELHALDQQLLSAEDRVTYQVLQSQLRDQLEGDKFPSHLLPIAQYGGMPVYLAQLGSGQDIQPLKTPLQYRHYLKRLAKIPDWNAQAISNMREGVKRGIVQPKALIVSGLPAIKALEESDLEKNAFLLAIRSMPDTFSAAEREQLTSAYKKLVEKKIIPSMKKLTTFLENEYLPQARDSAGIGELADGTAWYQYLVKYHTTTQMTPEQIHNLGLSEVARIRGEMETIKKNYNFNSSLSDFLRWQASQEQFKPFKSEQEILAGYEDLNKKIVPRLPQLFGRMPKAPLIILPEPELTRATASDHYNAPAPDGSRPGVYYAVIQNPQDYRNTKMTSLFLHEGQPGHHFQIALQQELSLAKFRKYGWFTAYGEGWALYAETLGKEMGLYQDPNQYLGHLKMELMRAVRLVTDTGLHAKGWTREQTIQYMMDTEGTGEAEARRATERYMAWPGPALAYKVGALKFQELRNRAQQRLGEKFSLQSFHDLVLSEGVLPLSILEAKVDTWIESLQPLASDKSEHSLK
ncbi:MAG TPA: DUF885 domain-containing protein [Cellvibrio sp.]|nr:DUF885 domain-containing protein [Cellvibrio sp.]